MLIKKIFYDGQQMKLTVPVNNGLEPGDHVYIIKVPEPNLKKILEKKEKKQCNCKN